MHMMQKDATEEKSGREISRGMPDNNSSITLIKRPRWSNGRDVRNSVGWCQGCAKGGGRERRGLIRT